MSSPNVPNAPNAPAAPHRAASQHRWLVVAAGALALALGLHGAIAQPADYHAFADARAWFGLPNAANVLSNAAFALIGGWGLWRLSAPFGTAADRGCRRAWCCFSGALLCTAFGSALYHGAPGNALLVLDRLPIAWACAALLCAFLSERVNPRWADVPALATALAAATAAVAWWWISEQRGQGDLRPYLYVQFLPMLLVPVALALKLPPIASTALGNRTWWWVLGLYASAKLMEFADQAVFDALGLISGHTLKHLLAAAAALCLVRSSVRAQLR